MPTPSVWVPPNLNEWDVKHGVSYKKKVSIEIIGVCCNDREIQFWLVLDATWLMTLKSVSLSRVRKRVNRLPFFSLMMLVISVRRQFGIESEDHLMSSSRQPLFVYHSIPHRQSLSIISLLTLTLCSQK